jgi:hypothetical protein
MAKQPQKRVKKKENKVMKLIDKEALVAGIMSRIDSIEVSQKAGLIKKRDAETKIILFKSILSLIDTLEVKEVDLDKEIDLVEDKYYGFESLSRADIIDVAKHFFEFGLKARTDKELIEEIYSHIDSIKDTADRMTSGNFMHNRAAIKFSANTIAKVLELMGLKAQKGE